MTKTKNVHVETFEEYKKRFNEHFQMERTEDGILTVKLSTLGGPAEWSYQLHNAMCELWTAIGHDKSAELLILTGADGNWVVGNEPASFTEVEQDPDYQPRFDNGIIDTTKVIERFVMDIDIPTIGVLPGKGFHWDAPILCDITLCSPEMRFSDGHYVMGNGTVPGDGMTMLMQHFMGYKQANYMAYTSEGISAEEAKQYGLVTEVVAKDKIMERAMEIARKIMAKDRVVRRLTHQVVVRPLKRRVMEEIQYHVTAEMYSNAIRANYHHNFGDDAFLKAKGL
jgi:enoyl-CoA hydratase/carnithine racemase